MNFRGFFFARWVMQAHVCIFTFMYRTELIPKISSTSIKLGDPLMAIGSCFAVHIGNKLLDHKFTASVNPFGTLFSPHSIFKLLNLSIDSGTLTEDGTVENQGIFYHFDLHSDFSDMSRSQLLADANSRITLVNQQLHGLSDLIITFGTAIVYEHKYQNRIVANCHKVPANQFVRRIQDTAEIVSEFKECYDRLKRVNPSMRCILTVSPVRHLKESFEQNSLSKSILRIACEQIATTFENVEYFPAYEIMMDDLRDYRFYAEDMLHPNPLAIEYIWQKFMYTYFDGNNTDFVKKWAELRKALNHRPFHPESTQHQQFIRKTIARLSEFSDVVNIDAELQHLKAQII